MKTKKTVVLRDGLDCKPPKQEIVVNLTFWERGKLLQCRFATSKVSSFGKTTKEVRQRFVKETHREPESYIPVSGGYAAFA